MLWKRQKEIEALVLEHLNHVDEALRYFVQSINAYVQEGDIETADRLALETHRSEGRADDVRRGVEAQLLSGALMPTSRRDILELVDQVDRLANAAESTLDQLLIQNIELPDVIRAAILEITAKTDIIITHVNDAIAGLFEKMESALPHTAEIERLEGEIDHIERKALKALFHLDIDLARKLQVNAFIGAIVELSDRAEDLSDHIELIVAQKHI
jgi:uncharacterized protein